MTVEFRLATDGERRRFEIAGTDSAGLVLVDGEVVAWTDDYLTAHLIAGTEAGPTQEAVEQFAEVAGEFYEAARR